MLCGHRPADLGGVIQCGGQNTDAQFHIRDFLLRIGNTIRAGFRRGVLVAYLAGHLERGLRQFSLFLGELFQQCRRADHLQNVIGHRLYLPQCQLD